MSGTRNGNITKLKKLTEELTNGTDGSFPLPTLAGNGYNKYKEDKCRERTAKWDRKQKERIDG